MTKTIDPVDLHVGSRVRQRRLTIKQSQSALASDCGLSFQQIQKYERGTNRVSASVLVQIAKSQDTYPGWYFEDLPGFEDVKAEPDTFAWMRTTMAAKIGAAMARLDDAAQQSILSIVEIVADAKAS